MEPDVNRQREQVHVMVERLAPDQLSVVRDLLVVLLDRLSRRLATAAIEDEAISEEEERAVVRAKEWLSHNRPIPHEQVLADFDLTAEEFRRMGQTPLPPERK